MTENDVNCTIREKVEVSVKAHQTLLNFSSDELNEEFQSWWEETGLDYFKTWILETNDDV